MKSPIFKMPNRHNDGQPMSVCLPQQTNPIRLTKKFHQNREIQSLVCSRRGHGMPGNHPFYLPNTRGGPGNGPFKQFDSTNFSESISFYTDMSSTYQAWEISNVSRFSQKIVPRILRNFDIFDIFNASHFFQVA